MLHGTRTILLQDDDGQVGIDYLVVVRHISSRIIIAFIQAFVLLFLVPRLPY